MLSRLTEAPVVALASGPSSGLRTQPSATSFRIERLDPQPDELLAKIR
jgi:hypothetical protein